MNHWRMVLTRSYSIAIETGMAQRQFRWASLHHFSLPFLDTSAHSNSLGSLWWCTLCTCSQFLVELCWTHPINDPNLVSVFPGRLNSPGHFTRKIHRSNTTTWVTISIPVQRCGTRASTIHPSFSVLRSTLGTP
jgi:hypothetical protein